MEQADRAPCQHLGTSTRRDGAHYGTSDIDRTHHTPYVLLVGDSDIRRHIFDTLFRQRKA